MAVENLAGVTDALSQLFDAILRRQTNRQAVLLAMLMKMTGRGKNVAWDVTFDNHTGDSSYLEGADAPASDIENDTEEDAILQWALRRREIGVSSLIKKVAGSSIGNAVEYLDLIMKKALDSGSRMLSDMNIDCFTGTGVNIIGLQTALATSGTYATIDKGVETEWQGNIDANGGVPRALTKGLLDALDASIFTAAGMRPSVIVTTPGVATKYENLLDAIARQILETGELSPRVGTIGQPLPGLDNGFTGLHYKGVPIYRDKDTPTGELYMLGLDDIEFVTLPRESTGETATSFVETMLTDEKLRPAGSMNVALMALAKLGSSDRFLLELHPQLVVHRPNRHGIIQDIDET